MGGEEQVERHRVWKKERNGRERGHRGWRERINLRGEGKQIKLRNKESKEKVQDERERDLPAYVNFNCCIVHFDNFSNCKDKIGHTN